MNNSLPFVTALTPTFRHPELLANSVALWNNQDYPRELRHMLILDDDPTFVAHTGYGFRQSWEIHVLEKRLPTISDKYNYMISQAAERTEIFLVWEDDDIYQRRFVSSHVEAMENGAEFSKADFVLGDYLFPQTGKLIEEGARGRFHSSMAIRKSLLERVGGWPDTKRADFDQQLMSKLYAEANEVVQPWKTAKESQFIYRWHSGAAHCQSTMKSPDDETWYDRAEESYKKVPFVGKLRPKLDMFSLKMLGGLPL